MPRTSTPRGAKVVTPPRYFAETPGRKRPSRALPSLSIAWRQPSIWEPAPNPVHGSESTEAQRLGYSQPSPQRSKRPPQCDFLHRIHGTQSYAGEPPRFPSAKSPPMPPVWRDPRGRIPRDLALFPAVTDPPPRGPAPGGRRTASRRRAASRRACAWSGLPGGGSPGQLVLAGFRPRPACGADARSPQRRTTRELACRMFRASQLTGLRPP
jgi:hypothetical protein